MKSFLKENIYIYTSINLDFSRGNGESISLWVSRVLNYPKSVWRIWQRFSCLLDEGIPKKCKKLNSHDGFLSYLQNSTAKSAHLAAHFCPALVSNRENSISFIFLVSPHQVDMKNVVKSSKHFFGYFNTLETHSGVVTNVSWFYPKNFIKGNQRAIHNSTNSCL